MDVEDDQFLNMFKGKRVKLTLKTSSYLGVIQRINTNKTLVLANVVNGSNGCKISGSKMFFGCEIRNVELVKETSTFSGHEDRIQTNANNNILDLEEDEEDCVSFVVVNEFQEKFGAAVMYIKKQHVIGVGGDGVEVYKNGRLCWLQIATKSKIYLFDILMLGARAFKNGLSTVLENKQILKVIHDCRALSGCLFGQFGVKLNYVFDTQVADVLCFYSETGGFLPDRVSTLEQVVSLHLQVPSFHLLSLQMKSQLTKEDMKLWQMRPCPVPLLKLMALSVIHLQPLRLVLLDNLMRDFVTLVDSYLNSGHYEPDEVQHVTMETLMELPVELKELVQIHRKRQEQAADRYPVNDHGLLARFSPRVQSPPRPSPATLELSSTRTDCDEPAAAKSPSSVQVDLIVQNGPVSPRSATSVLSPDVCASPDPGLPPEPSLSNLREDMSPIVPAVPLGAGRGHIEVTTRAEGRRRPFGKVQSSSLPLPTIRREVVPPTTSSSLQSSVVSSEQCRQ